MLSSYVRNLLPRLARKAGIAKRCHAHGLRHSFAAGLADERVDVRVIQRRWATAACKQPKTTLTILPPCAVIDTLPNRTW